MKYISSKAKWTEDGESYTQLHIVEGWNQLDHRDLNDEFLYQCNHIHDCCGCVNNGIRSTRELPGDRIAVRVWGWRNI